MLTTEQLNAIKERAENATAGPWEYIESDSVVITLNDNYHFAMEVAEELGHGFDGTFIAHSRTDIPALIAEVEKLRDEISLLCPIGDYDVITSLKSEKQYQAEIIAKLQSKIATYESLAQEFNYGAILDEMSCEAMKDYEGVNHDD